MEVAVRVQDPSGSVTRDVIVKAHDSDTVGSLIDALVGIMEWPRQEFGGRPLRYALMLDGTAHVDEEAPLDSLGLSYGDVLILGPVEVE